MADRFEQTETNMEGNPRVAFPGVEESTGGRSRQAPVASASRSEVEPSAGVRDALVSSEPVLPEPVRWDLGRWEDDGGRVVG